MTKLNEYAAKLADLYRERKAKQINLDQSAEVLEARRLVLTPAEGWPGKNEAQRDTARDKAFAEDAELQACKRSASGLRDRLAELEGEIEAQQALASAERWAVREKLAEALSKMAGIEKTEDVSRDAPEFDDVLQSALDAQAAATAEQLPWQP